MMAKNKCDRAGFHNQTVRLRYCVANDSEVETSDIRDVVAFESVVLIGQCASLWPTAYNRKTLYIKHAAAEVLDILGTNKWAYLG